MFQRRRTQELTDANCAARMKRAKLLLQKFPQNATGRLREPLKKKLSVFFSAGTAWSAAAWPPVNIACVPQLFEQLINTTLSLAFLRKFVCQPLCCVRLQTQTLFIKILSSSLNTMFIVVKHCSDVCCDEYPMPQIDRKSKQVKEQ